MPASIVLDDGRLEVRRVNVELLALQDSDSDSEGSVQVGGTRKRKRLTNLTPEEKMLRRKLKNRMAAQTARDRKKQKMVELEEALAVMEAENKKLQEENQTLKRSTTTLTRENEMLKTRLQAPTTQIVSPDTPNLLPMNIQSVTDFSSQFEPGTIVKILPCQTEYITPVEAHFDNEMVVKVECSVELEEEVVAAEEVEAEAVATETASESITESAELVPQQQESTRTLVTLGTALCIQRLMIAISLVHMWTWLMVAASSIPVVTQPPKSSSVEALPLPNNPPLPPWWGSHQRSWNPSKN